MQNAEPNLSLANDDRITEIIQEAEEELARLQPEISYLEQCVKKLQDLKTQQFKLISLKTSLKSLIKIGDVNKLNTISTLNNYVNNDVKFSQDHVTSMTNIDTTKQNIFLLDQAISEVKNHLRTKNNLNYEIFKAVVYNSGQATTEEIKDYLIENNIKQPKTGKPFNDVELKEISSRTNYLVRKNILVSVAPGLFRSVFGWSSI